ncbi:MAG: hypothetical protein ACREAM_08955 [Blastocatellia bacterium]
MTVYAGDNAMAPEVEESEEVIAPNITSNRSAKWKHCVSSKA